MNRTIRTALAAIAVTTGVLATTAGTALAQEASSTTTPPGVVIAEDTSARVTAQPTAPGEITVTTAPRTMVSVVGASHAPRNRTADAQGRAVFRGLTPGSTYRVVTPRAATTVMLPTPVGSARALRVATTNSTDEVALTWKHPRARAMGPVRYRVEAIPVSRDRAASTNTSPTITDVVTGRALTLRGLDLDTRYTIRVTPFNALGDGRATSARMNRSLGQVHAMTTLTTSPTFAAPVAAPEKVSTPAPQPERQAPSTAPTAPQSEAPRVASGSAPATRTVYVCPDGFQDAGANCRKTSPYTYTTRAYTYRDDVQTSPYTYRTVVTGSAPILAEQSTTDVCPSGWNLEDYGVMGKMCRLYGQVPTAQVKNAAPDGWTDNGTAYTRTVRVKDSTPAGFTDTGTEWSAKNPAPAGWVDDGTQYVSTTAKVATTVPA